MVVVVVATLVRKREEKRKTRHWLGTNESHVKLENS